MVTIGTLHAKAGEGSWWTHDTIVALFVWVLARLAPVAASVVLVDNVRGVTQLADALNGEISTFACDTLGAI